MAEGSYCKYRVRIERDHRLVFGNRFLISALHAEYLTFGEVHERVSVPCGQGLRDQLLGAGNVDSALIGHLVEDAERVHICQPALRLRGPWINRQRTLNPVDRFRQTAARRRFRECGASPKKIVQRIGIYGGSSDLRGNQLRVERDRYPARDLVLQRKDIKGVVI